jgi:glycosyltransferase involved in cell wall biosynthesis
MGSIVNDALRLSVVIATDGRSPHLGEVVGAAAHDGAVDDVMVVLNGTTVCAIPEAELPRTVRVLEIDQANLSLARNHGLEHARNETVAFLDDDAVPSVGWGSGYCYRFRDHSEVGAAGGPAWVADDDRLSNTLSGDAVGYLALVDFDASNQCEPFHFPFGCNFAVRRDAVHEVGGFRSDLGYSGGILVPHEETELFQRLSDAKWEIWWEAGSRVEHRVAPDKRRVGYLLRRAFAHGRGDVRLTTLHPDFDLDAKPLDTARVIRAASRTLLALAVGDRRRAMDAGLWCARLAGRVRGVPRVAA